MGPTPALPGALKSGRSKGTPKNAPPSPWDQTPVGKAFQDVQKGKYKGVKPPPPPKPPKNSSRGDAVGIPGTQAPSVHRRPSDSVQHEDAAGQAGGLSLGPLEAVLQPKAKAPGFIESLNKRFGPSPGEYVASRYPPDGDARALHGRADFKKEPWVDGAASPSVPG